MQATDAFAELLINNYFKIIHLSHSITDVAFETKTQCNNRIANAVKKNIKYEYIINENPINK